MRRCVRRDIYLRHRYNIISYYSSTMVHGIIYTIQFWFCSSLLLNFFPFFSFLYFPKGIKSNKPFLLYIRENNFPNRERKKSCTVTIYSHSPMSVVDYYLQPSRGGGNPMSQGGRRRLNIRREISTERNTRKSRHHTHTHISV